MEARIRGLVMALALAGLFLPAGTMSIEIQNLKVWTGPSATGPWTELVATPPTNTLYVGEFIKLELTLENTTGRLGRMCVIDSGDPYGPNKEYVPKCMEVDDLLYDWCTQNPDPSIYPGQYWVWPRLAEGCTTVCGEATNCVSDPDDPLSFGSYLYPTNPLAPVKFVSAEPIDTWDFNGYTFTSAGASNDTETVEWVFEAKREFQGMDFLVFAHHLDDFGDVSLDCASSPNPDTHEDPCLFGGGDCDCNLPTTPLEFCLYYNGALNYEGSLLDCNTFPSCPLQENPWVSQNAGGPTLSQILKDYWSADINIITPLTVSTKVRSVGSGTRPPNMAFIGDPIELAASVTNTGAFAALVEGRATPKVSAPDEIKLISNALTGGGCVIPAVMHYWPEGIQTILPSAEQTFTWSFTVTAKNACPASSAGGCVSFDPVDMGGAITKSPAFCVTPPPLAISVTIWLDPDGTGPEPAQPAAPHFDDPDGLLYYMSEDQFEARIMVANTSTLYSYDVTPCVYVTGTASSSYQRISGPAVGTVFLNPAPGPGSSTAMVFSYAMDPASFLATSCAGPGPFDIQIIAGARGVNSSSKVFARDHPFRTCNEMWTEISGLSGISIEVLQSFDVSMFVRNPMGRKITMSDRASAYLGASKPPGDSTDWLFEILPGSFAQTWAAGELKPPFTWRIKPTASGTLYLCTGVSYAIPNCVKSCPAIGCASGCPCPNADKIEVLWPQYLEILSFTATPTFIFADGGKMHGVALSLMLYNESPTETIYVESIKNPCVAAGTWEVSSGTNVAWGPSPAPPFEIPPDFSFPVEWLISSHCDVDRRWGFYPSSACAPLVYGRMLTSASLIQVADAVSEPPLTFRDPPKLECSFVLDATEYAEGQLITLYFSVTNTNQNDALDYSVTITADYMLTTALVSPDLYLTEVTSGSGPPPVLPGSGICGVSYTSDSSMHVYKAVYRAERAGKLRFAATSEYSDLIYGDRPSCMQVSPVVVIKKTSVITATAWATATVTMPQDCLDCALESGCQRDGTNCISVGLTVRNSGEVPVDGLTPSLFLTLLPCSAGVCPLSVSYTGSAVQVGSPPPEDIGQSLSGYDMTRSFTWTYSPSGIGCLRFRISVSGTDHETGELRLAEVYSNCVRILPQPPVALRLLSAPPKVIIGQEFEAQIEIENPGKNPVLLQGGEPSLSFVLLGTDAAVTEHFDVRLPPPVTVEAGAKTIVTLKLRALPTAPLGAVRLRVPEGSAFIALDPVTGLAWAVRDAGVSDPPVVVEVVAASYALEGADPNPFHPGRDGFTLIKFRIPETGKVQLKVYTITGELVRKIIDEVRPVGYYEQAWDGTNDDGQICASGIYLLRIEGPNYSQVIKLAIVK